MDIPAQTLLLSRTKVAALATTRDYLVAMRTAFADLADRRYDLPSVGHVPAEGGAFHIKTAVRQGSTRLAVIKVNGNFQRIRSSFACRRFRASSRYWMPNAVRCSR
jgi:ornithine cyclodeaminase/alanine dehydrogenase-like protein (mu-crystallin family)